MASKPPTSADTGAADASSRATKDAAEVQKKAAKAEAAKKKAAEAAAKEAAAEKKFQDDKTRAQTDKTVVELNAASGELAINIAHIDALIAQIKWATDCEVLMELAKDYLKQLTDMIAGVIKSKTSVAPYLAILKAPFPTPQDIVKWIKRLIGATALTQFKAVMNFIEQLILLAKAVRDLIDAIAEIDDKLKACALELGEMAIDQVVDALAQEVEEAIVAGLEEAGVLHRAAADVCGLEPGFTLDTSSPEGFQETKEKTVASLEKGMTAALGIEAEVAATNETTARTDAVAANITAKNRDKDLENIPGLQEALDKYNDPKMQAYLKQQQELLYNANPSGR